MKKVLSFVLVLAMILGSVATAFAAPYDGKAVSEKNTVVPFADALDDYRATVLRDLGAVDGDGTGNVNPDGELTRAEAYAFIVKAMGLGAEGAVKQATKFTDVAKDAWYSGYVAVAAAQKYTDGTGAKTFSPDAKMTKDEAIAAILKVIGYQAEHLEGAWPVNYRDLALNKGILGTVETGNEVATRADMIQLIYNCLEQPLVVWKENTIIGGAYGNSVNGLKLYQKMVGKNIPSPVVAIGTTAGVYYASDAAVLTEGAVAFTNKFDYRELLGQNVTLLYKNGTAGKPIGVYSNKTTVLEGTFDAASFTTFTAIDGTKYTFGSNATASSLVYVNGGLVDGEEVAAPTAKTVTYKLAVLLDTTKKTQINTVYSSYVEKVDEVIMIDATQAALLANDNLYEFLKDEDNATFAAFNTTTAGLTKTSYVAVDLENPFEVVGDATKLSEIKEDDIVEIYLNGYTKKIAKVAVTRNVVTGAVTKYDAKNSAYTVNGTAYKLGTTPAGLDNDLTAANVGNAIKGATEFAFYLNAAGKVAYAKFVTEPKATITYRYAFVLEAKTTDDYTLNDKTLKAVSNASIKLLPLDTMVAETFEMVSSGALTGPAALLTANVWSADDDKITPSALVYFGTDEAGELKYLAMANDSSLAATKKFTDVDSGVTTFSATGLAGQVSKIFADAKIYVVGVTGKVATDPAYYTTKTVADMAKATSKAFSYKVNANGRIDTVVVNDYSVAPTTEQITIAAILGTDFDATGMYITFAQPGKDAERLYASDSAVVVNGLGAASLAALNLKNGKITSVVVEPADDTTDGGIVYDAGVLKNDDKTVVLYETVVDDVVFLVWNTTDKVLEAVTDIDDINAALAKTTAKVDLYKAYQNDFFDVIVIR